jgi:DnaJ-class molecular chaperone
MAEPEVPGLDPLPPMMTCPNCQGWGEIPFGPTGPISPSETCPSCEGTGMVEVVDDQL